MLQLDSFQGEWSQSLGEILKNIEALRLESIKIEYRKQNCHECRLFGIPSRYLRLSTDLEPGWSTGA